MIDPTMVRALSGSLGFSLLLASTLLWPRRPHFSTRRVGGIRFIRIGRHQFTWAKCRDRAA